PAAVAVQHRRHAVGHSLAVRLPVRGLGRAHRADGARRREVEIGRMLLAGVILITSFAYLGILFAIAYYGDKRADAGRSIIANPTIYALSMAVYATLWTFFVCFVRVAVIGVGFC